MKYLKLYENFERDKTLKRVINSKIGNILPESDIYQYVEYLHNDNEDFMYGDIGDRLESFTQYELQEINLSDFNLYEWELDEDKVDRYIKRYKETGKYPPPVVDLDPEGIYNTIIDGMHRMSALSRVGLQKINAWVGKNK